MVKFYELLLTLAILSQNPAAKRRKIDIHFHSGSAGDYGEDPHPNPVTGKIPHF